jgi:cysteine desulfurase
MKSFIYLDYAATTPVDPRVAEKMLQFLTPSGTFGNPASTHHFGKAAKEAVENARAQVAELIHSDTNEIVWTSGATESNNLALKGAAQLYQSKGKHIITMKTEHASVLDCCQQLEKEGYFVTYLSPEKNGLLDLEKLRAAIRDDTILISVMHVNNELGVIQDVQSIANMTAERGILFHVDAAQSAGKIALDLQKTPIDLMSFSAHKIYGPKGAGALYVRRKPRVRVAAQIHGGGHEQGMRSGTLATHQIVGMGEAFHVAKMDMKSDQEKISQLSQQLREGLMKIKDAAMNTDVSCSIPNILNVRLGEMKSETVLNLLPEIAFSSGSACNAKGVEPSYVLRALGQKDAQAACGIRFSLGRFSSDSQIINALQLIHSRL